MYKVRCLKCLSKTIKFKKLQKLKQYSTYNNLCIELTTFEDWNDFNVKFYNSTKIHLFLPQKPVVLNVNTKHTMIKCRRYRTGNLKSNFLENLDLFLSLKP